MIVACVLIFESVGCLRETYCTFREQNTYVGRRNDFEFIFPLMLESMF